MNVVITDLVDIDDVDAVLGPEFSRLCKKIFRQVRTLVTPKKFARSHPKLLNWIDGVGAALGYPWLRRLFRWGLSQVAPALPAVKSWMTIAVSAVAANPGTVVTVVAISCAVLLLIAR